MDRKGILNVILGAIIIILLVVGKDGQSPASYLQDTFITEETDSVAQEKTHKKRLFGPKVAIYPEPAMVIGSYDKDGKPNVMAASWFGIANSKPLKVAVSLRPATHSYHNIMHNKAFTVNIPSDELASFTAFVGKYSGRDIDKFAVTGFHALKADSVNAPYVHEFPIILECKMTEYHDLGSHRQFIGQVVAVKIDEDILGKDNHVDFDKFTPLIVGKGGYFRGGDYVGKGKELRKVFEAKLPEDFKQKKKKK